MPIDANQLAALAVFGSRFTALGELTHPLQALVEAAHLKGRIDVLLQIAALDPAAAAEARQLVDLTLATLLDKYLDNRFDGAPVRGVVGSLLDRVKAL
jgi:hypothetical protein